MGLGADGVEGEVETLKVGCDAMFGIARGGLDLCFYRRFARVLVLKVFWVGDGDAMVMGWMAERYSRWVCVGDEAMEMFGAALCVTELDLI